VRFYLDNDTDAACRAVVARRHHTVWTAAQAGLADVPDDDQAVYSADKDAVLISHDQAFARRQRDNTTGQMILLRCDHPDGPEVLDAWLDDAVEILDRKQLVVIEMRPQSMVIHQPAWK
jgi:hypothetical protein